MIKVKAGVGICLLVKTLGCQACNNKHLLVNLKMDSCLESAQYLIFKDKQLCRIR